ncbi:MAG TPA: hypothetical protein DEB39_00505 [Planctomycetaceae bacterium]|nr:hypothetical protein [Planctomycetaceae bacterium]
MKTLLLLRHGKSSWNDPGLADYERPLLPKGERRTRNVADFMRKYRVDDGVDGGVDGGADESSLVIDRIVSSPAVRAGATARIAAGILGIPQSHISYEERLYDSSADDYRKVADAYWERFDSIMLVGHNPMITEFANRFLPLPIDNLPTSGCIAFRFQGGVTPNVLFAIFPKRLGS